MILKKATEIPLERISWLKNSKFKISRTECVSLIQIRFRIQENTLN